MQKHRCHRDKKAPEHTVTSKELGKTPVGISKKVVTTGRTLRTVTNSSVTAPAAAWRTKSAAESSLQKGGHC